MSNQKISNENLIESLEWRYAVKKFDASRRISTDDWQTLEDALLLAPSSYGIQPYKFVVVTDRQTRQELLPHAFNQSQITDCSHLVVFAAKDDVTESDIENFISRIAETRGMPKEALADYEAAMKGFLQRAEAGGSLKAWTAKQTYLPLGFLLESAAILGVDACPMEGFNAEEFTRVLGLGEEGYAAIALCALGFRDEQNDWLAPLPKVRMPRERIVRYV